MKNMQKFTAQQLTKKQMNGVKGGGSVDNCGKLFLCTFESGQNYVCSKNEREMIFVMNKAKSCTAV